MLYDFSLTYKIPVSIDSEIYLDPLYEAGCDDSMAYMGKLGCIEINFMRYSDSAERAINLAIQQTKQAIPDGLLCYIAPDLITAVDIEKLIDFSQDSIHDFIYQNSTFPLARDNKIYYLLEVLTWCKENQIIIRSDMTLEALIEMAYVIRIFNNKNDLQKL